jgi:predicted amidophosphoribosyltransferase
MNKKVLRNLYIKKKLTFSQIGINLNCCIQTVSNYLDKFKIPKRPHKYVHLFCVDCGKEISYYRTRCKKCAKQGELHSQFLHHITKEKLIDLYLNKKLTITALAKKFRCSVPTIEERMLRFKIQRRIPNARIIKLCIDCGKRINYDHIRCHPCASKFNSGKNNFMFGKSPNWKLVKYRNNWFRSYWEANFAKWLNLSDIKWKYEPKMFDLGNTTYTPDFYLPAFDCWIEIKGWENKDFKKKFKKWQKQYKLNNRLLFREDLNKLGTL